MKKVKINDREKFRNIKQENLRREREREREREIEQRCADYGTEDRRGARIRSDNSIKQKISITDKGRTNRLVSTG